MIQIQMDFVLLLTLILISVSKKEVLNCCTRAISSELIQSFSKYKYFEGYLGIYFLVKNCFKRRRILLNLNHPTELFIYQHTEGYFNRNFNYLLDLSFSSLQLKSQNKSQHFLLYLCSMDRLINSPSVLEQNL